MYVKNKFAIGESRRALKKSVAKKWELKYDIVMT
jgi:hypothetical protein